MIKRITAIGALLAISAFASLSCSSENTANNFLPKAAQGGMTEVQLGQMAMQRAGSDAVRAFGQTMVTDHTQANNELKQLAARKNITLPTDVSSKQKSMIDKLSKLSGAEFDKEYMQGMVKDHEEDVEDFQEESNKGSDAEVKAFAAKTLPVLQRHLQMARQISANTK
jgi:putative membrane protein